MDTGHIATTDDLASREQLIAELQMMRLSVSRCIEELEWMRDKNTRLVDMALEQERSQIAKWLSATAPNVAEAYIKEFLNE